MIVGINHTPDTNPGPNDRHEASVPTLRASCGRDVAATDLTVGAIACRHFVAFNTADEDADEARRVGMW